MRWPTRRHNIPGRIQSSVAGYAGPSWPSRETPFFTYTSGLSVVGYFHVNTVSISTSAMDETNDSGGRPGWSVSSSAPDPAEDEEDEDEEDDEDDLDDDENDLDDDDEENDEDEDEEDEDDESPTASDGLANLGHD